MNKNSILNFVTVIMTIVLNIGFVSCSKDDSNSKDNDNSINNDIVGTWKGYSCGNSNLDDLSQNHTLTLVFSSDGSGDYLEKDNSFSDHCSFNYEKESKTRAKAYISTRGSFQYYEIVENKMYVYGHGYGHDLDFLLTKQ
jgi:hypothetical protein